MDGTRENDGNSLLFRANSNVILNKEEARERGRETSGSKQIDKRIKTVTHKRQSLVDAQIV